jgi:hypothetical protein
MNLTIKSSLLAALAVTLFAGVAHADDPVAPRPTHKPENISQINGQLVPVGEHHNYDYSYKRFNIATNPIGMVMGLTSLQASVAVSHRVALRGDVVFYSPVDTDIHGIELTASAAVYFKQMYDGFFIEPGILMRSMSAGADDTASSSAGIQTLFGYHWMWDGGLNMSAAVGMSRMADDDGDDDVIPNGYLRFGYAF